MIVVERLRDRLVLITLSRPEKRNALTRVLIEELTHHVREADGAGVVLAGAGPSFCAGVDLREFAEGTPDTGRALIEALSQLGEAVRTSSRPVACAIQGYCLGGALELAACCDFRVCTPDAQLGMPEVSLGIPSVIDAVMLAHHIGAGRAHELLLTGDPIDGQTAFQWGLVTRLAPQEQLIDTAATLLERVVRHAPEAVAAQKRLHQEWLDLRYAEAVQRSVEPFVDAFRAGRPQRAAADRLHSR